MAQTFFQSEPYLTRRLAAVGRQLAYDARSTEEHAIWRAQLQGKLRELLGVDRLTPADPNPRITESVHLDGYTRQRVEICTEPDVIMPFYVLIPDGLESPAPAVIAPHGHGSGGKYSPAGVAVTPEVAEAIRHYNYDYGVQAVRRGYVVFCPDARGFGERRESLSAGEDQLLQSSCHQLAHMVLPLGLTVAGIWAWELSRLIDYALTRPEVAGPQVACIGLSGGGLQTLYLSALDQRVQCSVISGYFYGVSDSLLHLSGNCDCNYIPHLWEYADMGDIGALIAPTPLLIEAGTRDPLNGPRGIDNVLEQYEITRRAYTLLGAEDRLAIDVFDGEHLWHGEAVWDWLKRWVG
ncbi:MAG: alpha/beta hydrolase family protein [Anaerolineae bacterium]|jgi:dienelactone hydrolase